MEADAANHQRGADMMWVPISLLLAQPYQVIQEEGAALPRRSSVDFVGAGMTCEDVKVSSMNFKTKCTVSSAAGTATALASNPADCSAGQYATSIDAEGDLTCAAPSFSQLSGSVTDSQVPNSITIDTATTSATATALASNPSDCSANQFATTIAANGNLTCAQPAFSDLSGAATDSQVPNTITVDLATAATALASNPTDCGAGQYATAIAASGNLTCGALTTDCAANCTISTNLNVDKITFVANGLEQLEAWQENFSAFSDLTATEETAFGYHHAGKAVTATGMYWLDFVSQVPGVNGAGTGTAVLEVTNSAGTRLCVATAFACNAAAGTLTSTFCASGVADWDANVRFQWDTSSDCTTLPKGVANVSW